MFQVKEFQLILFSILLIGYSGVGKENSYYYFKHQLVYCIDVYYNLIFTVCISKEFLNGCVILDCEMEKDNLSVTHDDFGWTTKY